MSEMWRGVEVTTSGVEGVLTVVGITGGAGSVMDASGGQQKL